MSISCIRGAMNQNQILKPTHEDGRAPDSVAFRNGPPALSGKLAKLRFRLPRESVTLCFEPLYRGLLMHIRQAVQPRYLGFAPFLRYLEEEAGEAREINHGSRVHQARTIRT